MGEKEKRNRGCVLANVAKVGDPFKRGNTPKPKAILVFLLSLFIFPSIHTLSNALLCIVWAFQTDPVIAQYKNKNFLFNKIVITISPSKEE
jgi:hypothetical protein